MLQPGSTIGRYQIVALIDAGGMADVYRVRNPEGGADLALKVLPPEFARDQARSRRFYLEIRAAETLHHPNIVALRDVAEADGAYFYTMDLMDGGSLKSRICEGMRPDEALRVMLDISAALIHAHTQGFIHRDIKPGNILFRRDGTALLSDFGIVKVVGRRTVDTRTGMSIGSPHYMSPEQASGKKISPASDLYSLGIVWYEMLTGRVPFDAEESIAVALMHLKEPPPPLPDHLRRFQPIIGRLLAKNENKRFADAAALREAIIKLRTPRPLQATRIIDHAPRPRMHRMLWATGGGLLAVLVMMALFAAMKEEPHPLPSPPDTEKVADLPRKEIQDQAVATLAGESATQPDAPGANGATPPVAAGPAQLPATEPTGMTENITAPRSPVVVTPAPPAESHPALPENRNQKPVTRYPQPESSNPPPANIPARPEGAVQIVTTPAGARVWLDGEQQPGRTPLTLAGIAAGAHRLRVHKEGYQSVEDTIEIKPDMKLLDEIGLQVQVFTQPVDISAAPEKGAEIAQAEQRISAAPVTGTSQEKATTARTPDSTKLETGSSEKVGPAQQKKIPIVW